MTFLDKYYNKIEILNITFEDKSTNEIRDDIKLIFDDFMKSYFDYCKAYNEVVVSNVTIWNEKEILKKQIEKLINEKNICLNCAQEIQHDNNIDVNEYIEYKKNEIKKGDTE